MNLSIYQVDAFSNKLFGGNPAAIVPLEKWIPEELMQAIAAENNLAETAYFVPLDDIYFIRWFTPKAEVKLCGHATLASAHVLFEHLGFAVNRVTFDSKSGLLQVEKKEDNVLELDFPSAEIEAVEVGSAFLDSLNILPKETYKALEDYLFVFGNEPEIRNLEVDFNKLKKVPCRGLICTAEGMEVDFVSRFFAPAFGIDEDPVTGSAHTKLIPYWSEKLGKTEMEALQLSERKGHLFCQYRGDRVKIAGQAVTYLQGQIQV
ncbi:PhzF family phenazine biosynthesis protein [Marinilongibacter aquaticus]|uniref:PhzF family phenazine biosynthesis protein n=1 Tax=Marinilongibacter aquaticus TaxID=2975157 RepID=UPI0021BD8C19|nr:PhzF family phenazine biosynthesis protein [Marinilongibacter aquaticus]UBM59823.1 PhzF family phenazine biosynthesis protein [Marinilongibacter aquaticus]